MLEDAFLKIKELFWRELKRRQEQMRQRKIDLFDVFSAEKMELIFCRQKEKCNSLQQQQHRANSKKNLVFKRRQNAV